MLCRSFSKKRRLRKPSEFSAVYKNNQTRVKGQYFVVLAFRRLENAKLGESFEPETDTSAANRVGVVVSKKVSKLAVHRNRIKRLVRENYRNGQHGNGFDCVVIAKPNAATADNAQLMKELNYLWKKLYKRCATSS